MYHYQGIGTIVLGSGEQRIDCYLELSLVKSSEGLTCSYIGVLHMGAPGAPSAPAWETRERRERRHMLLLSSAKSFLSPCHHLTRGMDFFGRHLPHNSAERRVQFIVRIYEAKAMKINHEGTCDREYR